MLLITFLQALKALNESGVTKIHAASLEILENGALARPRCHTTNSELFIDMVLQAAQLHIYNFAYRRYAMVICIYIYTYMA